MRKIIRLITSIMVALMLVASLTINYVDAAPEVTREVDYILIEMENGNIVSITSDEYIDIYLTEKGPLYDFLVGNQGELNVYGVVSADKYIEIDEYIDMFLYEEGSSSRALESSEEISSDSFFKIKEGSIQDGNIQLEPIRNEVEGFRVLDIY